MPSGLHPSCPQILTSALPTDTSSPPWSSWQPCFPVWCSILGESPASPWNWEPGVPTTLQIQLGAVGGACLGWFHGKWHLQP
jgi:hypothetical protein